MLLKEINLRAEDITSALTEIKFELATARAESTELMIVKYPEYGSTSRLLPKASAMLRKMKQRRGIQLYAFAENFSRGGTESVYLRNKYPELFLEYLPSNTDRILYIKL